MAHFKHLTRQDRHTIEVMLHSCHSQHEIARTLGVNPWTISSHSAAAKHSRCSPQSMMDSENAAEMRAELVERAAQQTPPGIDLPINKRGIRYFEWYLDNKRDTPDPSTTAKEKSEITK